MVFLNSWNVSIELLLVRDKNILLLTNFSVTLNAIFVNDFYSEIYVECN